MTSKTKMDTSKVTRVEVINHTELGEFGRAYTYWHEYGNGIESPTVRLDIQDDGRTLKVFISPKGHETLR